MTQNRSKAIVLVALAYLRDRLELGGPLPSTTHSGYFRYRKGLGAVEIQCLEQQISRGELSLERTEFYDRPVGIDSSTE